MVFTETTRATNLRVFLVIKTRNLAADISDWRRSLYFIDGVELISLLCTGSVLEGSSLQGKKWKISLSSSSVMIFLFSVCLFVNKGQLKSVAALNNTTLQINSYIVTIIARLNLWYRCLSMQILILDQSSHSLRIFVELNLSVELNWVSQIFLGWESTTGPFSETFL